MLTFLLRILNEKYTCDDFLPLMENALKRRMKQNMPSVISLTLQHYNAHWSIESTYCISHYNNYRSMILHIGVEDDLTKGGSSTNIDQRL